jgi:hypothetical protein
VRHVFDLVARTAGIEQQAQPQAPSPSALLTWQITAASGYFPMHCP